jgi:serine/threonine protein phosphatase PrpC
MKLDENSKYEYFWTDIGSTSFTVFVRKNKIYCANVVDSRAVLYIWGKVNEFSNDNSLESPVDQIELKKPII